MIRGGILQIRFCAALWRRHGTESTAQEEECKGGGRWSHGALNHHFISWISDSIWSQSIPGADHLHQSPLWLPIGFSMAKNGHSAPTIPSLASVLPLAYPCTETVRRDSTVLHELALCYCSSGRILLGAVATPLQSLYIAEEMYRGCSGA